MTSEHIVDRHAAALADAPANVAAVYPFGSVARGTASPSSDLDPSVLLQTRPDSTLAGRRLEYEGTLERTWAVRYRSSCSTTLRRLSCIES